MVKLLTLAEVLDALKCSRSTIYVLMAREGSGFPAPLKVGRNNVWLAAEVEAWIADQAAARVA